MNVSESIALGSGLRIRLSSTNWSKTCLFLSLFWALIGGSAACTDEGHAASCEVGGQGNQEDDGCFTPVGGSCLSHDEFVENRPSAPDADPPLDPEADWFAYKEVRPLCDFADE